MLMVAALCGFACVAFGAFGAHGLKDTLSVEAVGWWQTATLSGLVHSALASAIALNLRLSTVPEPFITLSGWAFITGVIVFAGSLYAMGLGAPRWFGAITPVGGVCLLVGWAALIGSALKS